MVDMSKTIIAKSDQLNADDLIGRSLTIRVTGVALLAGEQPVGINYEGDDSKPYKPCKSMRRVLVAVWGSDGNAYVGRSMTLFRDDKVQFGGAEVGGIRISHMSGIDKPVTMSLTATKKSKKPFTVQPLAASNAPAPAQAQSHTPEQLKAAASKKADTIVAAIEAALDLGAMDDVLAKHAESLARLRNAYGELASRVDSAVQAKRTALKVQPSPATPLDDGIEDII